MAFYRRVKAFRPEVQVSAAVYPRHSWAVDVFQNWYAWLAGGYVDFVVPMAYVGIDEVSSLESFIDEWQVDGVFDRLAVGLAVADFGNHGTALKTSEQLILETELIRRWGGSGVVIFDIDILSDDQLNALVTGPFAELHLCR